MNAESMLDRGRDFVFFKFFVDPNIVSVGKHLPGTKNYMFFPVSEKNISGTVLVRMA